jgi:hypothetical protein
LADLIVEKCETFLRITEGTHQDMGSIPGEIERLKAKVLASRRAGGAMLHLEMAALIADVQTLRNNLSYLLERRYFYAVRPDLSGYYGDPEPFGDQVAKKFKHARDDIERAGNCLALGESTACVLHLNRAMEIVIRALARKLKNDDCGQRHLGIASRQYDRQNQNDARSDRKEKAQKGTVGRVPD